MNSHHLKNLFNRNILYRPSSFKLSCQNVKAFACRCAERGAAISDAIICNEAIRTSYDNDAVGPNRVDDYRLTAWRRRIDQYANWMVYTCCDWHASWRCCMPLTSVALLYCHELTSYWLYPPHHVLSYFAVNYPHFDRSSVHMSTKNNAAVYYNTIKVIGSYVQGMTLVPSLQRRFRNRIARRHMEYH